MFIIVMGWAFITLIMLWLLCAVVAMVVSPDDGKEYEWQEYMAFVVIGPLGLYLAIQMRKEDKTWNGN